MFRLPVAVSRLRIRSPSLWTSVRAPLPLSAAVLCGQAISRRGYGEAEGQYAPADGANYNREDIFPVELRGKNRKQSNSKRLHRRDSRARFERVSASSMGEMAGIE